MKNLRHIFPPTNLFVIASVNKNNSEKIYCTTLRGHLATYPTKESAQGEIHLFNLATNNNSQWIVEELDSLSDEVLEKYKMIRVIK
jgi:dolichyl-phosphate-mannose--protein O-mannosyl transferase